MSEEREKEAASAAAAAKDKEKEKEKEKENAMEVDEGGDEGSEEGKAVSGRDSAYVPQKIVVHPLVLLSVVDHYNRVARDTKKRVVGVLLGERTRGGQIDITNSYAVPFEEDLKDPQIWYLDHNYHESMFAMFKKVNAREKVVGWYSTGPKIRPADLEINELIRNYTSQPVLVIIDVNPRDDLEIPTQAYVSVENRPEEQSSSRRTFVHVPSEVGAYEAEEVGVEHLLRDIRDSTVGTVSDEVTAKLHSLKGLQKRTEEMHKYLDNVLSGKLPANPQILYNMQDIFNLSPNLKVEDLVQAFAIKTNDNMLVIYLASLIRAIIALHDLINNKIMNKEEEKKVRDKEREKKEKEKEKEKQRQAAKKKPEGDESEAVANGSASRKPAGTDKQDESDSATKPK